jgi:hypothetical protein
MYQPFFRELFFHLNNSKKDWNIPWIKIAQIEFFQNRDSYEINQIIQSFNFLKMEKLNCISINKIDFIIESMGILHYDIKKFSKLLDYRGFESLIKEILSRNGYYALNNFYFSDKSPYKEHTSQERYEIDIVGLKKNWLLLIDAKQWFKRSPSQSISAAANLQAQRGVALKKNADILTQLLLDLTPTSKNRYGKLNRSFPLYIIPFMVTLEDNAMKVNENRIPLVSIQRINAFLNELVTNLERFYYLTIENL